MFLLAICGFMPPAPRTRERGATSWALRQHHAGKRRGAATRRTPLSFSRETLFATERLSCLECFVLLLSKCLHSEFRFCIIENKFKFTVISGKVFLLYEPPSSLPKALLQQVIGPAHACWKWLYTEVPEASSRNFRTGAPKVQSCFTARYRVSNKSLSVL